MPSALSHRHPPDRCAPGRSAGHRGGRAQEEIRSPNRPRGGRRVGSVGRVDAIRPWHITAVVLVVLALAAVAAVVWFAVSLVRAARRR